jgi:hypothetical protein
VRRSGSGARTRGARSRASTPFAHPMFSAFFPLRTHVGLWCPECPSRCVAREPSERAGLPERRTSRGRASRELARITELAREPPRLVQIRDQREQREATLASRTLKYVELQRPHHELRPRPVATLRLTPVFPIRGAGAGHRRGGHHSGARSFRGGGISPQSRIKSDQSYPFGEPRPLASAEIQPRASSVSALN